jgi:hypothetical protein
LRVQMAHDPSKKIIASFSSIIFFDGSWGLLPLQRRL